MRLQSAMTNKTEKNYNYKVHIRGPQNLNKIITNRKTQHFVQSVQYQKVMRIVYANEQEQPNGTFGMRVKHAIRQKSLHIMVFDMR